MYADSSGEHDSITVRGSSWYNHKTEEGGFAIDFVREHFNLSFQDAVTLLLDGEKGMDFAQAQEMPEQARPPFVLPPANTNARRVYAYLVKQRGIEPDIISHFIRVKTLYEDAKHHNAVFVGLDEHGAPQHAHRKSTSTYGKSFRANVEGSDSRYGFHHIGQSDRLYVFEAPIDMLSFITIYPKNWQRHSLLTLNGVADKALLQTLKTYPHLKKPILCLDNDMAGLAAIERMTEKLKQTGYEEASHLLPVYKDWNDELRIDRGIAGALQPTEFEHTQELAQGPM